MAFDVPSDPLFKTAFALLTAFVLGSAIGLERQWRQRTAGLRTNVLVAVGAAAFVDLGMRVGGSDGAVPSSPMWSPASAFSAPASS